MQGQGLPGVLDSDAESAENACGPGHARTTENHMNIMKYVSDATNAYETNMNEKANQYVNTRHTNVGHAKRNTAVKILQ